MSSSPRFGLIGPHFGTNGLCDVETSDTEPPALESRRFSDIEEKEIEWLWPDRIAVGKFTMLFGDPDNGKSLLTLDIASRVSQANVWPDGSGHAEQGSVLILSSEDDPEDTIRPRLRIAGAELNKVHQVDNVVLHTEKGRTEKCVNLGMHVQDIARLVEEIGDVRLIIIDPISGFLPGVDGNSNTEVRSVLTPLCKMAAEQRVAVLGMTHARKGDGTAMQKAMGSTGFIAASRAAWVVVADHEEKGRRLMLQVKNNLAEDRGGLAFRIQCAQFEDIPQVAWEEGTVDADPNDYMNPSRRMGRPSSFGELQQWLVEFLTEPKPKADVIEAARDAGFSVRNTERAFKELGGVKTGKPAMWAFSP